MIAGWESKLLGEVLQLEYGKPLDPSDRNPHGRYPAYGANGEKDRTDKYYRDQPSIIVGRKGSAGEITLTEQKYWPLDVTFYAEFDRERYDLRFLYYLLTTLNLQALAKGVKPGINRNDVYALPVSVPQLPEQRRIVAILDEAFEGIATAKANAEKNLQNAKELFESHREVLLATGGDGWGEAPLRDLCDIKHGYAFEGEFFAREGDYVLLTPGNYFESGGYRDRGEKQKYFTGPIPSEYILEEGDLLVAMTEQAAGLLGSPLLVPESNRFLHNQRLGLVAGKPGISWVNEFFFHVFNLSRVRAAIQASAAGTKVRHTSPSRIGAVQVTFPRSEASQRELASRLVDLASECDRLASAYERKLVALDEMKKSLLHQAFTGQLSAGRCISPRATQPPQTSAPQFTAAIISLAHERHRRQQRERTFGHVKQQKLLHLVEALAGVDLGRQPMKDAAGPNDFPQQLKAEKWARQNGFYDVIQRDEGGYDFKRLSGFEKLLADAPEVLGASLSSIESVIDLLIPMDTQEAELFATVHAAWNNLLIDGAELSDEAIVREARDTWHPDKLKIPKSKFHQTIALIRSKGLVPNGSGKYVGGQTQLI